MYFSLKPFRDSPSLSHLTLNGTIARQTNQLSLNYTVTGALEFLVIPADSDSPTRKDELWQETCFEFFLGLQNSPRYWEFNLSPAGHWNVYSFESYRQGMQEEPAFSSLPFTVEEKPTCLTLNLEMNLAQIIAIEQKLDVAITAVIQSKSGESSYWALTHLDSQADFHLRKSFILEI